MGELEQEGIYEWLLHPGRPKTVLPPGACDCHAHPAHRAYNTVELIDACSPRVRRCVKSSRHQLQRFQK